MHIHCLIALVYPVRLFRLMGLTMSHDLKLPKRLLENTWSVYGNYSPLNIKRKSWFLERATVAEPWQPMFTSWR